MKRISIIFLQMAVVLLGICVLIFMFWEPLVEGRNVHATLFAVYFKDPFLAYIYIASISFFVVLYQTFRVLGYIGQDKTFSTETIRSLRIIRYGALALAGFVCIGALILILNRNDNDDPAGGLFVGFVIALGAIVTAAASVVLERIFQSGIELKSDAVQRLDQILKTLV